MQTKKAPSASTPGANSQINNITPPPPMGTALCALLKRYRKELVMHVGYPATVDMVNCIDVLFSESEQLEDRNSR